MEDWDAGGDGGFKLGKRQSEKGEVDYKTKPGTAWSHSYLNQKPWHPLSYPNQRRKWIAEQTYANRERRAEEVSREFAQEQEFFRQAALFSKKEKEKMEMMKAVSFMYVRPPGYNAECAKAAEVADEKKRSDGNNAAQDLSAGTTSKHDQKPEQDKPWDRNSRPKDVFGRPLPTESEFEVLKNAPRLETGMPGRVKPFGVEIRNVRCVRCGTFGHQSGDRECPLKDAILPNEESRLKRDDPLTAIMAQTSSAGPVKWELKQKPGMSPPRGGFQVDDPNQQIVADEIFDEYGGFLSCGDIPALLTNFSTKSKKSYKNKSKHKNKPSAFRSGSIFEPESSNFDNVRDNKRSKNRNSVSSDSEIDQKKKSQSKNERHLPEVDRGIRRLRNKHVNSPDSDVDEDKRRRSRKNHASYLSKSDFDQDRRSRKNHASYSSESEAFMVDGSSAFETNRKKLSKHEKHLSEVGRERRRLRNKPDYASDSDVDTDKNRSGKNLVSYPLESKVDRDDVLPDSEIDWKKRLRSKHEGLSSEVDRERRSRNKHDNFSDTYVDKEKKRSMKNHATYSSEFEVDRGRGRREHGRPRNKHGNNSADNEVDRRRKMSENKHEKSNDMEVNSKGRSLRNKDNRSPKSELQRGRRRPHENEKKMNWHHLVTSDSESLQGRRRKTAT